MFPHPLFCYIELFVPVCVQAHVSCLVCSPRVRRSVCSVFSDGLCCFAAVYRTFFFLLLEEGLLLPCNPLPLTFLYVAFLLSPFSCHCTLLTGVLWPLHRQLHILAGISRHLSAVLGQWCLHSDVYSIWTPNVLVLAILPQFLQMHKCVNFLWLTGQDLKICVREMNATVSRLTMWLMFTGNGFLMASKRSASFCFSLTYWKMRWVILQMDAICASHKHMGEK